VEDREEQGRGDDPDGDGPRDDSRAEREKEECKAREKDEVGGRGIAARGGESSRGEDPRNGKTLLLRELPEGEHEERNPLRSQQIVVTRESREPIRAEGEDDAREKRAR
jgi:hypothetical protein